MTCQGYFPGYRNFPGYGRSGIKTCKSSCRNPGDGNFPGYEKNQDMEIILDMEVKNHTIYRTNTGRRKKLSSI